MTITIEKEGERETEEEEEEQGEGKDEVLYRKMIEGCLRFQLSVTGPH